MKKSKQSFFSRFFLTSMLEAWAKMSDDIARTAIIALPGPMFYYDNVSAAVYSILGLLISAIVFISLGVVFRRVIANREEK